MKYFDTESLTFFRGLSRHNAKPWFEAHRDDYEGHVRTPLTALVREMDSRFSEFAPEFVGDPKRSIFRLNRDIRFSADKSPYKTHAAAWFFHVGGSSKVGREAHGGGARLSIESSLKLPTRFTSAGARTIRSKLFGSFAIATRNFLSAGRGGIQQPPPSAEAPGSRWK